MRGIGSEPVEVWLRDGRPERFVWRGRMYFVLFARDTRILPADSSAGDASVPDAASGETAPGDTAARETAASEMAAVGDPATGRQLWLVEATAQRSGPATTYELSHDLASGRWTLSRGH